ncbi:MAG TPA: TonB-dependent receptor [Bacteroidales bacterium]|nr:TonB-dependent receptor plug domain-containing protein [Bacteroidales bacterium]HNY53348.1 TonB-dependent receptor [Bacteroidales bacterium]HOG57483.1 TonB-dependent receptor [Bacteroidales bacterium]HPX44473.1 TonB-dependent receptor [Bacteroidales bacterium]
MKQKIFYLALALMVSGLLSAQADRTITWDYSGQSFGEFVTSAEKELGLKFFFRDEWMTDIQPGLYPGRKSLGDLLDNLFRDKSLFWFIDEWGNVIITRNFAVKLPEEAGRSTDEGNFIAPVEYYDSDDEQKLSGNLFVDIGNPADRYKSGNVTITGYIIDRDTREAVAGATVFVQKLAAGALSNQYGFYSLTLPRGIHQIRYSFIGMREQQVNVNLYGSGELDIEMNSMLIPLKETTITADRNVIFRRYEVGVEKVNITSLKLLPTSMGESDIIKSVLLIPGVQSVGEGSAGFNVRGGSSDQNLILLYGAPVYNSSHFFGFFSAVNSDIIRDVTLYKGGIPARFGGRISSVLDIVSRDGNRKEFNGNAGISPVTAHLMLEGPIKKDTSSYILTGRSTYSNWVFDLIDNAALKNSMASFYDVNGRIAWDVNSNNRLDISSYISHDSFRFNSDTLYAYDNNIVALRWRHFFSKMFFAHFTANNSNYSYNVSSDSSPEEAFILSHKVNSTGLKADFNWYQGRNEVNFGADMTRYSILPGSYQPADDSSLVISRKIPVQRAVEAGLYIDEKYVVNDFLSVNAGIRYSSFFAVGPATFYNYDPRYPRNLSTVTDTISYGSGKVYKVYGGPEFRLSFNFRTGLHNSFKLNYNRTRQYLHLLSNTTTISPTDTWKLSDYHLKPQTGDQVAAGFYQMLLNGSLETSVELYYKRIGNMVDFKSGTDLVMAGNIEKDLVNVRGKAYGLEVSMKKEEGRLRWSLGYTYSRTLVQSTGHFSDEIINRGEWFPASFDKPHDLVATFNLLFSRRFSLSANYNYSTGRPVTYPVAFYYMGDILMVHYSDRNKYRVPDYMRLDLSVKLSGSLRSNKIANPHWIFSVYNLLGRKNVYSIYFKNENNRINGYKLSIFGQAIPSLSFNFDF